MSDERKSIIQLDELTSSVDADILVIVDETDTTTKKITKASLLDINGLTEKTTPVDADMVRLLDSAASNILKKLSWANIKATIKSYIMPIVYPVGSIYINASVATNPSTLLGFGTWIAFGAGRVMVGIDPTDTDFDTVGEERGAKTVAGVYSAGSDPGDTFVAGAQGWQGAHSTIQPSVVVYIWKRTV